MKHIKQHQISFSTDNSATRIIEYPGNLTVFDQFGGCGTHPQFKLLQTPPAGYSFCHSSSGHSRPRASLAVRWRALVFGLKCLRRGAGVSELARFFKTRWLQSQELMGRCNASLVFFPSVPFHFNQFPWMIEIEDSTSLFFPFIHNGATRTLGPVSQEKYFPIIQELIHSHQCKGIVTHVKSTADSLPILFGSPELGRKIFHIPVGVKLPDWEEVRRVKCRKNGGPLVLFTNSWHQDSGNFYLRGGLDVLDSFQLIKRECADARLIIRSELPPDFAKKYPRHAGLIAETGAEVVGRFLEPGEWEELKMQADYFILPAARIHVVSLLEAMAYGMTILTSNGWGMEDYVKNDVNAVVVPGRNRVTWIDWETGILREDYSIMFQPDHEMAAGLARSFMALQSNPALKERITRRARADVENIYTIPNWNDKLGRLLDHIHASPEHPLSATN